MTFVGIHVDLYACVSLRCSTLWLYPYVNIDAWVADLASVVYSFILLVHAHCF